PDIDFSKQVVLGVLAGEKEGSGYMVQVRKVIIRPGQEIVVYAVEQRARPNKQTNNDSPPAYPFQIITIPRLDLPVRFEFQ
ncbi:MAG: protease complex subunit PrcB family protein, partial [Chloroflexi bacterium]|nr:protease complex subunit PrcB family protein [Chloroflexota bacterium]